MAIANSIVANAVAANRNVARNTMSIEEQRIFRSKDLPRIEKDVSDYEKQCKDVVASTKAIAAKVSAIAREAEKLGDRHAQLKNRKTDGIHSVFDVDEAKYKKLMSRTMDAHSVLVDANLAITQAASEFMGAIKPFLGNSL